MKIRTGRKQDRNLYIQFGAGPSDEDDYLGVIFDPARARRLVEILNEYFGENDAAQEEEAPGSSLPGLQRRDDAR